MVLIKKNGNLIPVGSTIEIPTYKVCLIKADKTLKEIRLVVKGKTTTLSETYNTNYDGSGSTITGQYTPTNDIVLWGM